MPREVLVGSARICQTIGPIRTQIVDIQQRPGRRPTHDKKMLHVEVGDGLPVTLCEIPVMIPERQAIAIEMRGWRDQALAAVGILASILDERVAQEHILEDVVVLDETGIPFGALDVPTNVRTYQSANIVMNQHRQAIERLKSIDLANNDPGLAAVRWYLGAAQAGPVPDSIVALWIALEALTRPAGANKSFDEVKGVENALQGAVPGLNPQLDLEPNIGRLYGLRSDVVHKGMEDPPLLREGYYTLEMIVRLLLRHHFGIGVYAWPARVDEPNLRSPWRWLLGGSRTRWRE